MNIPNLGELESAVMEHLWAVGQGDAKSVHRALKPARPISLNTIQSTVERLARKGLLVRHKVSRAYVYVPTLSREDWAARVINEVLGDAPGEAVLAAFVDYAAAIDTDSLDRLEQLVAARKRREAGE
ncbi:MAG: BlaI/MecI/CopY family transcriptional regulator [Porticoccaceae bacterium]|jgi:predicted transcriptional regulator|nr:BlaI/MecI/CopY family transcriptional regulator [Porticoccaceae bacterium]MEA3300340.1 BlaI/MecI/CopY family transcriptional regulator [Pseudomonadota bacterium]HLS97530.1 BlaI/MecI/CopY family transcriptional regulator [Porticoccaceae bacterium]